MFVLGRKTEKLRQARFVILAGRTLSIRLDPFGMFLAQGVVDLVLKLNVRPDFARNCRRSVCFHRQHHQSQSTVGDCACVGFSSATREVIVPPSFEIGRLCGSARASFQPTETLANWAQLSKLRLMGRRQVIVDGREIFNRMSFADCEAIDFFGYARYG